MKAFLIDPLAIYEEGTPLVYEVDYSGDWRDISKMISMPDREVRAFDIARINNQGDGVYVDDEGLFDASVFFTFKSADPDFILAGRGLVLGCDEEGNSISPHVTLEWLKEELVIFDHLMAMNSHGGVWLSPLLVPA